MLVDLQRHCDLLQANLLVYTTLHKLQPKDKDTEVMQYSILTSSLYWIWINRRRFYILNIHYFKANLRINHNHKKSIYWQKQLSYSYTPSRQGFQKLLPLSIQWTFCTSASLYTHFYTFSSVSAGLKSSFNINCLMLRKAICHATVLQWSFIFFPL